MERSDPGDRGPGGSTGPGLWSRKSGPPSGLRNSGIARRRSGRLQIPPHPNPPPPPPPPSRPIAFAPVDIACHATAGGGFQLPSRTPLGQHDSSLGRVFRAAVEAQADRVFLAERSGHGWRALSYAASRSIADGIAAAF